MKTLVIEYETPLNTSIQAGDLAFYVPTVEIGTTVNTFATGAIGATLLLGSIVGVGVVDGEVYPRILTIVYDDSIIITPPVVGDFLMFAKDRKANTSSLKGYYADVSMVNDSRGEIELFAIGLGTTASSK